MRAIGDPPTLYFPSVSVISNHLHTAGKTAPPRAYLGHHYAVYPALRGRTDFTIVNRMCRNAII
jgi:hypothetical protein